MGPPPAVRRTRADPDAASGGGTCLSESSEPQPGRFGRCRIESRSTTIGTVNEYDVRIVRTHGEFTRHRHPETDEFCLVLAGSSTIRRDACDVTLGAGEVYIVRKGVQHQPVCPR
jgi:mannose-6-phosphate isomerase-like protein (cupin superfamily)